VLTSSWTGVPNKVAGEYIHSIRNITTAAYCVKRPQRNTFELFSTFWSQLLSCVNIFN